MSDESVVPRVASDASDAAPHSAADPQQTANELPVTGQYDDDDDDDDDQDDDDEASDEGVSLGFVAELNDTEDAGATVDADGVYGATHAFAAMNFPSKVGGWPVRCTCFCGSVVRDTVSACARVFVWCGEHRVAHHAVVPLLAVRLARISSPSTGVAIATSYSLARAVRMFPLQDSNDVFAPSMPCVQRVVALCVLFGLHRSRATLLAACNVALTVTADLCPIR